MIKTNSARLQIFLFIVTLGIFFSSLWKRLIHIDDYWLGEYSYWLSKLGYVRSDALRGYLDADTQLFMYHKAFNLQGAWLINWFGLDPYILKALSLVYLALSLPILFLLYKKSSTVKLNGFLLGALFLSFFHTMNLSFVFRPEINLVFIGLLGYFWLDKYLSTEKNTFLLLSALLTGLGIATHLNGVVFTGAAVLLLWIKRRWLAGLIYGTLASWGLVFFVAFDARTRAQVHQLYLQLTGWRDVEKGSYGWSTLIAIFQEHLRYLHSVPEIAYSLLLLLLIIPARKLLLPAQKQVLYYALLVSLCVAEVTHGPNTNYIMYAFPFFILVALWSFESLIAQNRIKLAWTAVLIFVSVSWAYNLEKFSHREFISAEYRKLVVFLPKDASVLAPPEMLFEGLGHQQIQVFVTYQYKVGENKLEKSPVGLFQEAAKFNNDFVILDQSNAEFFGVENKSYSLYELLEAPEFQFFKIYKRIAP